MTTIKPLLFLVGVFALPLTAQTCLTSVPETTPTSQFTINTDGTVTDNLTGIMWMRCSIGQSWDTNNQTCTGGVEQLTWQQALKSASQYQYAGFNDWQLPNVKELSTIVDRQCVDAAINQTLFPATLAQNYWTSTSGVGSASQAWAVAFYSGKTNLRSKTSDIHLRLMRYAK
ncbi:DUF1566 domain-containing protein [Pseudoalteromonas sp. SSM20]|uniref:Lcl C-terminal domain-containing protein n=1 Tax=Pseudoalteromonas sp. SSM20 TaxID=3139394 RepID=UPI003BABF7C8